MPSSDTPTTSLTPSPSRETKGIGLFRAISRKLSRTSVEDVRYPDERSSSAGFDRRLRKESSSQDSGFRSVSPNQMSSSSSTSSVSGGDQQQTRRHHHSASEESVRKVFQKLNLDARSQSCSSAQEKRKSAKAAPKRILRRPMTYTYVKGLSGLPTQRIPRTSRASRPCGCGMQPMSGLNR